MNNGYKKYNTLLRVADGGIYDGEPLDINGELCSITGLPQASKPNVDTDPDYIEPVYDPTECPLPTSTFNINYDVTELVGSIINVEIIDNYDSSSVYTEAIDSTTTGTKNYTVFVIGTINLNLNNSDIDSTVNYEIIVGSESPITGSLSPETSTVIPDLGKDNLSIKLSTV